MTIEEKLKNLILKRYHSIREFANTVDIPNTTIHTIFKRGIENSSVSNVILICKALRISVDALADGEIVPITKRSSTSNVTDCVEINDILADTKDYLTKSGRLTLDGKPISKYDTESIIDAVEVGIEVARRKIRS